MLSEQRTNGGIAGEVLDFTWMRLRDWSVSSPEAGLQFLGTVNFLVLSQRPSG